MKTKYLFNDGHDKTFEFKKEKEMNDFANSYVEFITSNNKEIISELFYKTHEKSKFMKILEKKLIKKSVAYKKRLIEFWKYYRRVKI